MATVLFYNNNSDLSTKQNLESRIDYERSDSSTIQFGDEPVTNVERDDANHVTVYLNSCGFYITLTQEDLEMIQNVDRPRTVKYYNPTAAKILLPWVEDLGEDAGNMDPEDLVALARQKVVLLALANPDIERVDYDILMDLLTNAYCMWADDLHYAFEAPDSIYGDPTQIYDNYVTPLLSAIEDILTTH